MNDLALLFTADELSRYVSNRSIGLAQKSCDRLTVRLKHFGEPHKGGILIASACENTCMDQEESNESTEFTKETSEKKPAPRKDDKALIEELNEEATEMDDLLDYDEDKDVGA